jgi:hypothetical protein
MTAVTITPVSGGTGSAQQINNNFQAIELALDKCLAKEAETGNELNTDIDANGYDISNVGVLSATDVVVNGASVSDSVADSTASAAAALASEQAAAASAAAAAADAAAVANERITWLGAWSGAATYAMNDAVSESGSSYICTQAHTNQQPPNAAYWDVLAAQGSAGAGTGDLLAANNLSDVANAAIAFDNIKQGATTAATGVVELATDAEAQTGTDTARAVTPANVAARGRIFIGETIYTANDTWNRPTGCTYIEVEVVGAGGGGGGALNGALRFGGGGGAGSWAKKRISSPAASYAIVVGTGGAGGSNTGTAGGAGTDTTVGSTVVVGKGGSGGSPANTGTTAVGGNGGVAGTGDITIKGGDGFSGFSTSSATYHAGWGGQSPIYGRPVSLNLVTPPEAGTAGEGYGNGGRGGVSTSGVGALGGSGANGIVVIRAYR